MTSTRWLSTDWLSTFARSGHLRRTLASLGVLVLVSCGLAQDSKPPKSPTAPADAPERRSPIGERTVFVEIVEEVEGKLSDRKIVDFLVSKKLALHRYKIVKHREDARFIVSGLAVFDYHKRVYFEFEETLTHLEHQFIADVAIKIENVVTNEEESVTLDDIIHGRHDRDEAIRDTRRFVATQLAREMSFTRTFGNSEIVDLVKKLRADEGDEKIGEIVDAFVEAGTEAVPYLLGLLFEPDPVIRNGSFPGVKGNARGRVRRVHLADLALARILDRESALKTTSDPEYEYRVAVGWHWAWEDRIEIQAAYRTDPKKRKGSVPASVPAASKPASRPAGESESDANERDAAPAGAGG